jgi:hypothetical protein
MRIVDILWIISSCCRFSRSFRKMDRVEGFESFSLKLRTNIPSHRDDQNVPEPQIS